MEPKVIFEDEDLLVLDKPAGMIVNRSDTTKGERTMQDWVEEYLKVSKDAKVPKVSKGETKSPLDTSDTFSAFDTFLSRAGIVHRLDKETSGILLIAKNSESFTNLQAQFKERKVQKTYIALSHGKIEPDEGEINVAVGRLPWNRKRFGVIAEGRESVTKYKVIRYFEVGSGKLDLESLNSRNQDVKRSSSNMSHFSLLELYPKTGRTHQIRVHLQYIKHPIFSDPLYAGRKTSRNDRKLLPRVFLHAAKISFIHPKTNQPFSFESPLPSDLERFLSTFSS